MTKQYLYVLGGYAGDVALGEQTESPIFEYQQFARRNCTKFLSLSSLGVQGEPVVKALNPRTLVHRLRLATMVASQADRYDAIIASGEDIGIFIALALRAAGKNTRIVIITHGPQFQSMKFRLVLRLVRGMPNVIFSCLSKSLAEWLIAHHGIPASRCRPTGYGIDTDFYRTDPGPTAALVASAGSSNRDYDTLIRAVSGEIFETRIAAHSNWIGARSTVIGPLPNNVELRSYGNYVNLRELYRRARVVVVPTHDVPFAAGFAVIAEAMATGTPVIATEGRVLSDFVVPGVTGLLVPPGDVEALKHALVQLMDHPNRAASMGSAAAAMMRSRYSLDSYVSRLETEAL